MHEGIGFHREILAAISASVGLWLSRLAFLHIQASALRATHTIRSARFYEPLLRRVVVGISAHELKEMRFPFGRFFRVIVAP